MPNYLDNPAGRLYSLYEEVNKVASNQPALDTWAKIFGLERNDTYELMRCATEMMNQYNQTCSAIRELDDDDPELLLLHFGQIRTSLAAFRSVANTAISAFQLSGEAMYGLRSCSSVLHRRQPEQVIDEVQVKELIVAVRELLDEVLASEEIDQQTKRYIRDRLM